MKKLNKDIGNYCENIASTYLSDNKYTILDRNFRTRTGELDIICIKNDILIVVEVKGRYYDNYGLPCECVNKCKQKSIINCAKFYITANNFFNYLVRFDVVEVYVESKKVNLIKNAFDSYLRY